jgi:hypothetical protein
MTVLGRDCVITLKTQYREIGLPYAEETIREAVSLLKEEAAIEGDGVCGVIRKPRGVTGCVITPLTLESAPLLLALVLGRAGAPLFVSESRNLYKHDLHLWPDCPRFDLIQQRGMERRLYESCRVEGFELRIDRGEESERSGEGAVKAVMLRLDVAGNNPAVSFPADGALALTGGERFTEQGVRYAINGGEHRDIYGFSVTVKKAGGTRAEVRIHRVLRTEKEFPAIIEGLTVTAQLYRERYGTGQQVEHHYGMFRIRLSRLVLMADETIIDSTGPVIGPLRYYCAGGISAEVFTDGAGELV